MVHMSSTNMYMYLYILHTSYESIHIYIYIYIYTCTLIQNESRSTCHKKIFVLGRDLDPFLYPGRQAFQNPASFSEAHCGLLCNCFPKGPCE